MAGIDRTVQAVYDKAIYLIDAQKESDGNTMTGDTKEYQVRTIGILNGMLDTVYPASDTFNIESPNKRPALPDVTSFDDELDLDPYILRSVLPHGLAAKLLSEENPTLANYFQQLYEQNLAEAYTRLPADFDEIENPYGGIEKGQYGAW